MLLQFSKPLTLLLDESPKYWSDDMALAFPNFFCASVPGEETGFGGWYSLRGLSGSFLAGLSSNEELNEKLSLVEFQPLIDLQTNLNNLKKIQNTSTNY